MEILSDLSKIPLFSSMQREDLVRLAEIIQVRAFCKGDIIFHEGDPAQGLFYIKSGKVQMSKTTLEGKQAILHIFGAGEVLAEAVLFADAPYPATAETVEPATIYFLAAAAMHQLMLKHPHMAIYIIKVLSQRLRTAQEKLKAWAFASAESRVARLLVDLATKHGRQGCAGLIIDIELTHARLAALSGLTRETVSRVLGAWRSQGMIDTTNKRLIIKELERLKECCQE